jgi:hypothetical protein
MLNPILSFGPFGDKDQNDGNPKAVARLRRKQLQMDMNPQIVLPLVATLFPVTVGNN